MKVNDAVNAAATAVRAELIRLDYVEGDDVPDGEDKAIAIAAIRAFLEKVSSDLLPPTTFTDFA
jgi:hypothetical protein